MGLFDRRYYKPGKGVDENAPEKNAFFRFFELYGRRFWRFLEVNILYVIILLPILMAIYAMAYDALYTTFENWGYTGTYASYTQGNLTVTANEIGASGNDYTLDVYQDKHGTFTVTLYTDRGAAAEDSSETVDTWFTLYEVSTVDELAEYENDYVTFSGTGSLETIHDAPLSGGDGMMSLFTPLLYLTMVYYANVPQVIQLLLLALSVLAYGPMRCGVTYVLRNYSRRTHSWISDIWDKAKENWKQGMLFGVIDCLLAYLIAFNMTYTPAAGYETFMQIARYLSLLVGILYIFMRKYIYLMIVTVRLNLSSLIKNAWLLVFIGIFRNFFSGLANLLIWIVAYLLIMAIHPFFEIVFLGFLIYSFTNFLSISACYPLINKYLVEPIKALEAEQAEAAKADSEEEPESEEPAAPPRDHNLF